MLCKVIHNHVLELFKKLLSQERSFKKLMKKKIKRQVSWIFFYLKFNTTICRENTLTYFWTNQHPASKLFFDQKWFKLYTKQIHYLWKHLIDRTLNAKRKTFWKWSTNFFFSKPSGTLYPLRKSLKFWHWKLPSN